MTDADEALQEALAEVHKIPGWHPSEDGMGPFVDALLHFGGEHGVTIRPDYTLHPATDTAIPQPEGTR